MQITPEQLATMEVFNDDVGFELSYPVYDGVDPLTHRTEEPPRVFIRPSLASPEETPITGPAGHRIGYLGVSAKKATEAAKYGLDASSKKPLLISATLPRSLFGFHSL